jgi:hypothetical protein
MKLTSLFPSRPRRTRQRTAERPATAPKPARKRSLNEAAHKMAR